LDARSYPELSPQRNSVIRAALIGSEWCWCHGLKTHCPSPVLAMCRALVAHGFDPARRLEAYRVDTLCLTVTSLAAGAALEVAPHGVGFRIKPVCEGRPAPPVAPFAKSERGHGNPGAAAP
jgi:hypothetical protein